MVGNMLSRLGLTYGRKLVAAMTTLFLLLSSPLALSPLPEPYRSKLESLGIKTVDQAANWVLARSSHSGPYMPDTFNPREALQRMLDGEHPKLWCCTIVEVWMILVQTFDLGHPYYVTTTFYIISPSRKLTNIAHATGWLRQGNRLYIFYYDGRPQRNVLETLTDVTSAGNFYPENAKHKHPDSNTRITRQMVEQLIKPEWKVHEGWQTINLDWNQTQPEAKKPEYKPSSIRPSYIRPSYNYRAAKPIFRDKQANILHAKEINADIKEKEVEESIKKIKAEETKHLLRDLASQIPRTILAASTLLTIIGLIKKNWSLVGLGIVIFILLLATTTLLFLYKLGLGQAEAEPVLFSVYSASAPESPFRG